MKLFIICQSLQNHRVNRPVPMKRFQQRRNTNSRLIVLRNINHTHLLTPTRYIAFTFSKPNLSTADSIALLKTFSGSFAFIENEMTIPKLSLLRLFTASAGD